MNDKTTEEFNTANPFTEEEFSRNFSLLMEHIPPTISAFICLSKTAPQDTDNTDDTTTGIEQYVHGKSGDVMNLIMNGLDNLRDRPQFVIALFAWLSSWLPGIKEIEAEYLISEILSRTDDEEDN